MPVDKSDAETGRVTLPAGAKLASYEDSNGVLTVEYNRAAFLYQLKYLVELGEALTSESYVRMYIIPGKGLAFDVCEKHES